MDELITLPMLRSVKFTNKELTALTGFSNPSVWAKQPIAEHHQVNLRPVYADRLAAQSTGGAAENSAAPTLPVDEPDQRKIAAVDNLTSQIGLLCNAGLHLVPIPPEGGQPTKAPKNPGWNKPVSASNQWGYSNNYDDFKHLKGYNFGLAHLPSKTAAFDIDDLTTCLALFEDVGLPIQDWLADPKRVEIQSGKPNRGKLLFRLPEGVDSFITRQFSHKKVMLFELRNSSKAGTTVQDICLGVHPETGTNYQIIGDIANIPIIPDGLLDVALHFDEWMPCFKSALGIVEPPKFAAPMKLKGEHLPGFINPITKFNETYTPEDILIRNGYRAVGKDRFIRPNSSSKAPGVVILRSCKDNKPRAYSFGGDVLNDGFGHDSIDIYRLLECGGAW